MRSLRTRAARLATGLLSGLALGLGLGVSPAGAQGYRGWMNTSLRYIELRPQRLDSVPRAQVEDLGGGRFAFEGRRVQCRGEGFCTLYAPGEVDESLLVSQDAAMTFWGFGAAGLSATVMVRGRARVAGDFVWPRSDDAFDALLAYAQYVRGPVRVRMGRQRTLSGLGFTGFDGADVLAGPFRSLRVELYGGRSLARALNEPRNEALRGIEDFVVDRDAYLVGGWLQVEPVPGTALDARYQREIWADRSGLISERASLDLKSPFLRPVFLDASVDYDFAFGRWGKAHVRARVPFLNDALMVEGTLRRYLPYFELSTVWGFFSPVAYTEGEIRGAWTPRSDLGLWLLGSHRSYGNTGTDILLGPLEDSGWRLGAGADWGPAPWRFEGRYGVEFGPGAFLSTGDASALWSSEGGLTLGAQASAFQQIEEFRVGEGAVVGLGGLVGWEIPGGGARLDGGLSHYWQLWSGQPARADWNQLRAWTSVRVELGGDPGLAGEGR